MSFTTPSSSSSPSSCFVSCPSSRPRYSISVLSPCSVSAQRPLSPSSLSPTSFLPSSFPRRIRSHGNRNAVRPFPSRPPSRNFTRQSIRAFHPPAAAAAQPTLLSLLSTIVGVCVLIGSLLYKIPQLLRVVRHRSAAGISLLMYALETIGTTFSAVYFARRAFPFASYGESVFIMAQNVLLIMCIVLFEQLPKIPATIAAILYTLSLILLYSNIIPLRILVALQVCSIPILNLARVPQIALNWRRKGTGQLSPITLGLQLLGNVARIFTTIAQVRDPLMFIGICVATCFNTTLFAQWIYYSRRARNLPTHSPS